MNPNQIHLVQASFARVQPIAAQAAALFYGRLFELDPSLRALFRNDLEKQGQMLMSMIGGAVRGLRQPAQLVPTLRQLGARHADYGVTDAHYATVGGALLWTLEQGLGEAFTQEVREAWAAAYDLLAGAMKGGARETVAV